MKNLHFTQANKTWFYTFNSNDRAVTFTPPTVDNANGWIALADVHSKTQALNTLKAKFPNSKPIYTIYNIDNSKRTPFQKKEQYRTAERRFKDRLDASTALSYDEIPDESLDED